MVELALYLLFLLLYLVCAGATISYPKLPVAAGPQREAAETERDRWVIGHALLVIGVAIYAIRHVEDWHVNIESAGLASLVIHGYLFKFAQRISKVFWHWFIWGFDFLLIAYGIFLSKLSH